MNTLEQLQSNVPHANDPIVTFQERASYNPSTLPITSREPLESCTLERLVSTRNACYNSESWYNESMEIKNWLAGRRASSGGIMWLRENIQYRRVELRIKTKSHRTKSPKSMTKP